MRNYVGLVPLPLNPEITAYWTMWGTAATAVVTGLLAFFAWKAWQAALATIKGQKTSEELAAMGVYVRALNALARVQVGTPAAFMPPATGNPMIDLPLRTGQYGAYIDSLCHEVESAGSIWRAYHRQSKEMVSEFKEAEQELLNGQIWRIEYEGGRDDLKSIQLKRNSAFANELAEIVSAWQVVPNDRIVIGALVGISSALYARESPCRPTKKQHEAT